MTTPTTSHIALDLLREVHPPAEAEAIFLDKVKRKPVYLRPTEPSAADGRSRRRQARLEKLSQRKQRQKPRPLSAKEKRSLKLYDVPREAQKYHIYEPLHRMWIGYIHEVLGDNGNNYMPVRPTTAAKLCSADFHGAELEVVRARCVSRVGLKGIVIKDTKFTFEIVTRGDEVKLVPKEHCIFRFEVPPPPGASVGLEEDGETKAPPRNMVFELHGSQFENRAPERANKKFKQKNLPDL
ncbi:MAG: tRNA-splicing endonuclease subunit [Watsoniomyces obsoletus]|nr:MAG: tRNA-splicing endonuclease subunit [Watsoniomyces obsoletus]